MLNEIVTSKRPVILVGNGCRPYTRELRSFLNKTQYPTLTTWRAADIINGYASYFFGRPGMVGQRAANFILQASDFVLCLGARLDLGQVAFNYDNFAPKATKMVIDIDQAELDKLPEDYIKICYDVGQTISYLDNNILYKLPGIDDWCARCCDLYYKYDVDNRSLAGIYSCLHYIAMEYSDKSTIVLGSSGSVAEVFFQVAKLARGSRVINTPGLGSMGFALPAAIGAHYAAHENITCIDGDGSFAMNMQELALVAQNNLPITIFIINNGGYASIQNTQDNLCEGRRIGSSEASGLCLPNYEAVAKSFGIPYCKDQVERISNATGPEIHEMFTGNHVTLFRTKTVKQEDGTFKASGLENLWPFLPEEEIEEAIRC